MLNPIPTLPLHRYDHGGWATPLCHCRWVNLLLMGPLWVMCLATEGGHHCVPHPKHGSRRTLWNLLCFFFISGEIARGIQSCPKSSIKFKFSSTLLLHKETSRRGVNPGNQIMKVSQGWGHPQPDGTKSTVEVMGFGCVLKLMGAWGLGIHRR